MCANSATWNMNDSEDNDLLQFRLKYKKTAENLRFKGYRKAKRRVIIFLEIFKLIS